MEMEFIDKEHVRRAMIDPVTVSTVSQRFTVLAPQIHSQGQPSFVVLWLRILLRVSVPLANYHPSRSTPSQDQLGLQPVFGLQMSC